MKTILIIISLTLIVSCSQEPKNEKFINYLATIPDLELPFKTNSYLNLNSKIELDTIFYEYNAEINGVLGKGQINDSIFFIVNLLAGDNVFPELVTYNKVGLKIHQLALVHCPGGSGGYNETGSSYLFFDKDNNITITDSIETFERDSTGVIIENSRNQRVEVNNYKIDADGKIKNCL